MTLEFLNKMRYQAEGHNCSQSGQNHCFHPRMKKEDELNGKFRKGMGIWIRGIVLCKCICKIFQSTVPQEKVLELLYGHCGLVPSRMMKRMPLPTRISQSTVEVLKDTIIRFNMYRGVAGLLVNPNP